ncbi:MAG: hypothetical protein EB084_12205, partial [Proteobacteria bacterium]|nr:hypothetical protein [Pseudomonadota bacterium]
MRSVCGVGTDACDQRRASLRDAYDTVVDTEARTPRFDDADACPSAAQRFIAPPDRITDLLIAEADER